MNNLFVLCCCCFCTCYGKCNRTNPAHTAEASAVQSVGGTSARARCNAVGVGYSSTKQGARVPRAVRTTAKAGRTAARAGRVPLKRGMGGGGSPHLPSGPGTFQGQWLGQPGKRSPKNRPLPSGAPTPSHHSPSLEKSAPMAPQTLVVTWGICSGDPKPPFAVVPPFSWSVACCMLLQPTTGACVPWCSHTHMGRLPGLCNSTPADREGGLSSACWCPACSLCRGVAP